MQKEEDKRTKEIQKINKKLREQKQFKDLIPIKKKYTGFATYLDKKV